MADCASRLIGELFHMGLADDSALFRTVSDMVAIAADELQDTFLTPPNFKAVDVNVPVGGVGDGRLQDVTYLSLGAPPELDTEIPDLESATYKAIVSLVDLDHVSPTIPDISYRTAHEPIALPDVEPDPAPLAYPFEEVIDLPAPPGVGTVPIPTFTVGNYPALFEIEDLQFVPEELGLFEAGGLDDIDLPDPELLDWQDELTYGDDADLRQTLKDLMAGDGELGLWVQELAQSKLYDAGTRKIPVEVKQQLDQIFSGAAASGMSLPAGSVDKSVATLSLGELDQSFDTAHEVGGEVFAAAAESLLAAITSSVQVERYHFQLFMRYLQQNLRVYQINLRLASEIFTQVAAIYNHAVRYVRLQVDAYNQYAQAISALNRAIAANTDLFSARVQTFLARVGMYRADVSLRRKAAQLQRHDVRQQVFPLDEYRAELQGKLANIAIVRQNVEAFQKSVQAYSRQFEWAEDSISAFEAATDAGASAASVNEEKLTAYRRLWSSEGDRASAYRDYVQSSFGVFEDEMRRYREVVGTQRDYLSAVNQALTTAGRNSETYATLVSSIYAHAEDYNTAKVGYTEAHDAIQLSDSAIRMAEDTITAQAKAHEARLDAARESAKLTAAGALAQASSAIFQLSISADGTASQRVSGRDAGSVRTSGQDRKSFSSRCVRTARINFE